MIYKCWGFICTSLLDHLIFQTVIEQVLKCLFGDYLFIRHLAEVPFIDTPGDLKQKSQWNDVLLKAVLHTDVAVKGCGGEHLTFSPPLCLPNPYQTPFCSGLCTRGGEVQQAGPVLTSNRYSWVKQKGILKCLCENTAVFGKRQSLARS